MAKKLICLSLIALISFALYQRKMPSRASRVEPSPQSSVRVEPKPTKTKTEMDKLDLVTNTSVEFDPASLPATEAYRQKLASHLGGDTKEEKFVLYGLLLAEVVERDRSQIPRQKAFLEFLRADPKLALSVSRVGLQKLPASIEYSVERSGLVALLDMMVPLSEEEGSSILYNELTSFTPPARPILSAEMSEAEQNEALSSGFEYEHLKLVFDAWLQRTNDVRSSESEFAQAIKATPDSILKETYYNAYLDRFPLDAQRIQSLLVNNGVQLPKRLSKSSQVAAQK